MADRPIFNSAQLLKILSLAMEESVGNRSPMDDDAARHVIGDACLMLNDLMLNEHERKRVAGGSRDDVSSALMVQMCGPFEIQNPATPHHLVFRSRIMYRQLLQNKRIVNRIRKECQGFNFRREFKYATKIALSRWLKLIFAFYAYYISYVPADRRTRLQQFLVIDRLRFGNGTPIPQRDIDAALASVSATMTRFENSLRAETSGDWRFDFVTFRNTPLLEMQPGRFCCTDASLLLEKLHGGVFRTISNALPREKSSMLTNAWGVLFEEYVNWFLKKPRFKGFKFLARPYWTSGEEALDGALLKRRTLIPMEYKGGFLLRSARYSGNSDTFEKELETKMVKGCKQMSKKIEQMFHLRSDKRNERFEG